MSRNETWKEAYYANTLLECFPLINVLLSCLKFILEGTFHLQTEHFSWTVNKICGECINGLRKI